MFPTSLHARPTPAMTAHKRPPITPLQDNSLGVRLGQAELRASMNQGLPQPGSCL